MIREIVSHPIQLQNFYLQYLLDYSRNHIPYYHGLNAKKISDFPVLQKRFLREESCRFISDELSQKKWHKNSSGGSTGIPLTFFQDDEFSLWSSVTKQFYHEKFLKIDSRTSNVVIWGSERDLFSGRPFLTTLQDFWNHSYFFNAFYLNEEILSKCVEFINKKKPVFIRGYASSLYELARFIRRKKTEIWRPRFLYSSAETLHPFMRDEVETVFERKVYNFYGSREVGPIAGECKNGSLHLFSFQSMIEIVNKDNNSLPINHEGRVLVTTLHNYVMPLIRYEIGDTAILGTECSCGSSLPVLKKITGRTTDHFLTRNNEIIHGEYFTHLFYFRSWVGAFQVLQEDFDRVSIFIELIPGEKPPREDMQAIDQKIKLVMGKNCQIDWKMVEQIPRTPQGKLLFTRSLIYAKEFA